jgi:putative ABC transport system ATP-binding protein
MRMLPHLSDAVNERGRDAETVGREPAVLEVDEATRVYGSGPTAVRALGGATLTLRRGESAALIGPSGSGKTTLLQLAGAMDRPTSGRVLHAGVDLATLSPSELTVLRRRHVGFVFQFFNLVAGLSAEDNVGLVARLDGMPRRDARKRARDLLTMMGLGSRFGHLPGELSGGEQQRVAIARALVNRPRLVLADEPTGNLDKATGHAVMDVLSQAALDHGVALLLVTHDTRILSAGGRVLEMADGRLLPKPGTAPSPVDPVR